MKILAYRFSAMGDVALCVPVLRSLLALNPELEITFVTRPVFTKIFPKIDRLHLVGVDLNKDYVVVRGLWRLSRELKANHQFDFVCDLHQVLRTQILNVFLNMKTFKIDKGRSEKKNFIKNLHAKKLKHTSERYLDVFRNLKLIVPSGVSELAQYGHHSSIELAPFTITGKKLIGFAPFAKHFTKAWPIEYVAELLKLAEAENNLHFVFFGGGASEVAKISKLEQQFKNVTSLAGKLSLPEEIEFMKKLDVMIAMDSANMHLASLAGCPIISIWGGTHPDIGFSAISNKSHIIEIARENLHCRPCSIFGRSDCPETHFKCMREISPQTLFNKVHSILSNYQ